MTRPELLAWLDARRPEVPATLSAHLRRQLAAGPEPLPELLAARGRAALDRVLAQPGGGRALALDLLAADALVTYAFEAQAAQDPRGLVALARLVSGGDA